MTVLGAVDGVRTDHEFKLQTLYVNLDICFQVSFKGLQSSTTASLSSRIKWIVLSSYISWCNAFFRKKLFSVFCDHMQLQLSVFL
jgi:hypothetical protein